MFDKNLVHAIIRGKDLDRGPAKLSVNLVLTRGHGSLLLGLYYLRAARHPETIHQLAFQKSLRSFRKTLSPETNTGCNPHSHQRRTVSVAGARLRLKLVSPKFRICSKSGEIFDRLPVLAFSDANCF
jgi:hypothetical protein